MPVRTSRPVSVPGGARRLVCILALVFPLAALAAAAGTAWTEQQELTPSDGMAAESFGVSVSVSGDTAVIGAGSRNNGQGAAYVFVRSNGVWTEQQELAASDGATGDYFGNSVSVSGDTAVSAQQGEARPALRTGGGLCRRFSFFVSIFLSTSNAASRNVTRHAPRRGRACPARLASSSSHHPSSPLTQSLTSGNP